MGFNAMIAVIAAVIVCVSASGYGYGSSHHAPAPSYHAPAPSYHAPAPYHPPASYVSKYWSAWGHYGSCSVTCGHGEQRRYRTCKSKTVYGYGQDSYSCSGPKSSKRRCYPGCCPVNGNWGHWSSWSKSKSYGYQYKQTRTRSCNYPAPSCGGAHCYGDAKETKTVHAPAPSYHAPAPSYHAPAPSYHAPAPSYHAPAPSYHAPAPTYHNRGRY